MFMYVSWGGNMIFLTVFVCGYFKRCYTAHRAISGFAQICLHNWNYLIWFIKSCYLQKHNNKNWKYIYFFFINMSKIFSFTTFQSVFHLARCLDLTVLIMNKNMWNIVVSRPIRIHRNALLNLIIKLLYFN